MWTRTLALVALAPALAFAKTSVTTGAARDARAGTSQTDARPDGRKDTATIVLGAAGQDIAMDKLRVVIAEPDPGRSVRLVFTLSTAAQMRRQAVIPLGLPRGARITGAAVTIGNEARMVASSMSPGAAREEYQSVFRLAKDPVLVEQVDPLRDVHAIDADAVEPPSETRDAFEAFTPVPPAATSREGYVSYVVRAFPLIDRDKALVELTIELPDDATRLAITHVQAIGLVELHRPAGDRVDVRRRRDVRAPIAMDLPPVRPLPASVAKLAERTHVNASTSLYAGFAPPIVPRGRSAAPIVRVGIPQPLRFGGVDKTMIRRMVKRHTSQLARCYTRVTEYRGGPEGTAVMHFVIAEDGTVSNAFVDGEIEDPRITECLVDQLVQWQFSPGDGRVVVNYPLHFRIAKP